MHKDDINQKVSDNKERQKKKSGVPQDKYGDAYVDPARQQYHHEAGKGDKIRDINGWYSDEITERLEKIFGKKKQKEKLDAQEEKTKTQHDE